MVVSCVRDECLKQVDMMLLDKQIDDEEIDWKMNGMFILPVAPDKQVTHLCMVRILLYTNNAKLIYHTTNA